MRTLKLLFVTALGATLFAACADTQKIQGSEAMPSVQGKVKANEVDNDMTELSMELRHLAPPERVGANHYIVWVQPEGGGSFQNVGPLVVDNDQEAEYKTTIPYEEFRVLVTAENNLAALSPSGPEIFQRSMDR